MIFAFMADVHLSTYSQDKTEEKSNLPERLYSIRQNMYEATEYCINNGIEIIIYGGDILHGKSIIYAIAQEIMIEYFNKYNKLIRFIVIDGNHDLSGKGNQVVSALRSIENIENLTWVRFDKTLRIEDDIFLVPYSYNLPEVIKQNKSRILISHFGLSEATLNSGMSIISEISIKDLVGRYELVLLGHYHKPQEIIRPEVSIYYSGSLIQLDWGEKGDQKRFLVVDSNTLEVTSVPLTNYKKHLEFEVTSENFSEVVKLAKQAKDSGDHVKFVLKEKVDTSSIDGEFNIVDKTERDITNRGITSSMSQEEKFKRYLEITEVAEEEHTDYLNLAKNIIEECEKEII